MSTKLAANGNTFIMKKSYKKDIHDKSNKKKENTILYMGAQR